MLENIGRFYLGGSAGLKKVRLTNFELLRMLSMYMIVILHALGHGGILTRVKFGSIEYIVFWYIDTLCTVAVPCFVLISGYFLSDLEFKISRIVRLELQILFYSILCSFIGIIYKELTLDGIIHAIFPITSNEYWFITVYMLLLFFVPFLNKLIINMNKRQHLMIVCILICLFSIVPTFLFWSREYFSDGYDLFWFVTLYFIGSYIRRYGLYIYKAKVLYFTISIILLLSRIFIGNIVYKFTNSYSGSGLLYNSNSCIILISALCLFCVFKNYELKNKNLNKFILKTAPLTLGIYLFHNNTMIKENLWDFLNISEALNYGILFCILKVFLVSCSIFVLGCIIEQVRRGIFNIFKIDILLNTLDRLFKKVLENKEWGEKIG